MRSLVFLSLTFLAVFILFDHSYACADTVTCTPTTAPSVNLTQTPPTETPSITATPSATITETVTPTISQTPSQTNTQNIQTITPTPTMFIPGAPATGFDPNP